MKFIDLSHQISNKMSTYPSDPIVSIVREKEIDTDGCMLHSIKIGTHSGSHLDVPSHIIPGSKTLDDFPLSKYTGTAVKLNEKSLLNLNQIEEKIDGIIYDTGWYRYFNDPNKFYGPNRPILPESLVEKVKKLDIKFFGCDLPSVDASNSKEKIVHLALLGADIIIYESLTNLDKLPLHKPFLFYGFPLRFDKLDGSPVRAVALFK